MDLLSLNGSRLQQVNQQMRDRWIIVRDSKCGLELAVGLRQRGGAWRGQNGSRPGGYGKEFAQYLTAGPENCAVAFQLIQLFPCLGMERRRGKARVRENIRVEKTASPAVGAIDIFAAKCHVQISQSAFQNGQ